MSLTLRGHHYRWTLTEPHPEAEPLASALGTGGLVAELLVQRGVCDVAQAQRFFDPKLTHLHDPAGLPGADRAAARLAEAVRGNQTVAIYGDYDVDGVAATAILYHTIKTAAPEAKVICYVPHRLEEGYGLNSPAIEQLADDGAAVIISVDCGITSHGPAQTARQRGVDLIITDHHEHDEQLPDAYALVHPRLAPEADAEPYPWPDLCGAGVAYKVAWEFARRWCGSDKVTDAFRTLLVDMLPLAAMATIADIVPLSDENRALVTCGLTRIKHTPLVGLNALITAAKLDDEKIDSQHVGFVLGPRLNACGRMGHADKAVYLLTAAPEEEAPGIAAFLNKENERRRRTGQKIFEKAKERVEAQGFDQDDKRAIVLADPDWHPGVVGIVCSKLVEAYGRPTILLGGNNGMAKGSGRSIDGFNLHAALSRCDRWFESFGGHAMAAGLTLKRENVDAFRDELLAIAAEQLEPADLVPGLRIDGRVRLGDLSLAAAQQLDRLGPFGRSNPRPVLLIEGATVRGPVGTMGQQARHLTMTIEQDAAAMRVIGWNMADLLERLAVGVEIDIAAEVSVNTWRGRSNVELILKDLCWR